MKKEILKEAIKAVLLNERFSLDFKSRLNAAAEEGDYNFSYNFDDGEKIVFETNFCKIGVDAKGGTIEHNHLHKFGHQSYITEMVKRIKPISLYFGERGDYHPRARDIDSALDEYHGKPVDTYWYEEKGENCYQRRIFILAEAKDSKYHYCYAFQIYSSDYTNFWLANIMCRRVDMVEANNKLKHRNETYEKLFGSFVWDEFVKMFKKKFGKFKKLAKP